MSTVPPTPSGAPPGAARKAVAGDRGAPRPPASRGRLLRNFLWNLSAGGWGVVLALVSTPLVVGGLGVEQYGVYALLGVLVAYLSFTELGLSKAVERHAAAALGAGDTARVTGYFGTALWLQLGIAGLVAGGVATVGPQVLHFFQIADHDLPAARAAIRWIALNMGLSFITGVPQALLQAHQQFALLNRISIVSQTVLTGLVVGGAMQFGTLEAVVIALVIGTALRGVLLAVASLRLLDPLSLPFDRELLGELLRFGGSLTLASLLAPVLVHAEKLMLGALVSATSLTFYMVPYRVLGRLGMVSSALRRALFPVLSQQEGQGDLGGLWTTNLRATELLAWLLAPGFAVLWIASDTLLTLWMGEDFARQAAPVLPFLTLGSFFNLLAVNAVALIQARGRPGLIAYLYVVEVVLYLPVAWWLMRRFGVAGAAAAWCCRVILDFVLLWGTALYLTPGHRRVAPARVAPLALGVVVYAGAQVVDRVARLDGTFDLVVAGATACSIALMGWFLGLDRRDREALLSLGRRARPSVTEPTPPEAEA